MKLMEITMWIRNTHSNNNFPTCLNLLGKSYYDVNLYENACIYVLNMKSIFSICFAAKDAKLYTVSKNKTGS